MRLFVLLSVLCLAAGTILADDSNDTIAIISAGTSTATPVDPDDVTDLPYGCEDDPDVTCVDYDRVSQLALLLFSIFLGTLGVDRFCLGEGCLGVVKLLTCGGCGIWWIVDIILIAASSREMMKDADGCCIRGW
jgi:TM2 domain-containing membrane protein YozV